MRTTLEQRAVKLREQATAPSEQERATQALRDVEVELDREREATSKAKAEARLAAIQVAYDARREHLAEVAQRVDGAAQAFRDAIQQANGYARELALLCAEASALKDRFGCDGYELPVLGVPGECFAAAERLKNVAPAIVGKIRPTYVAQADASGRKARTYAEVRGTEAARIIAAAGVKPAPATPRAKALPNTFTTYEAETGRG